ncbi:hypothetical protein P170DRAFT_427455 [Aspergillus steynii IBT 23096]|uniref:Uncharacterized protein n=1 Tax=Aspergillus steynii IBT 23096 TaxID=1392250 RepID=A0A2I2G671_9EURO|nr:uncharacterized protein P170DRAFT_427455 [Aspergillus steynii IBT 23096]PLB48369.1 hypothetical protein P170DRAFT_427455 [Aspergillus steynii IBT 23096]
MSPSTPRHLSTLFGILKPKKPQNADHCRSVAEIQQDDQNSPSPSPLPDIEINNTLRTQTFPNISSRSLRSITPVHETLWLQAYRNVKDDPEKGKYVQIYEPLLAEYLRKNSDTGTLHSVSGAPSDVQEKRLNDMISDGLKRIENFKTGVEKCEKVIGAMKPLKTFLDGPLKKVPLAALPWAVISSTIDLLYNPAKAGKDLCDGIDYTTNTMKLHGNCTNQLLSLDYAKDGTCLQKCRSILERQVLDMYELLLFYQVKSVCYFHRGQYLIIARGLLKLDDWDGDLEDIRKAETDLQLNSIRYEQMRHKASDEEAKVNEKYEKFLESLCSADPRSQLSRIQDEEELIEDLYSWVFQRPEYQQFVDWEQQDSPPILYLGGGPGTGKTRILSGTIKALLDQRLSDDRFRANNSVAILRGLIWLLLLQHPQLFGPIQSKAEQISKGQLHFSCLCDILHDILKDGSLGQIFFVVDGVDRCDEPSREQLLSFISEATHTLPKVKWIISGRPHGLQSMRFAQFIDLDGYDRSNDINVYIERKTIQLRRMLRARKSKFDEAYIGSVEDRLRAKRSNTFLCISMVCNELHRLCQKDIFIESVWDEILTNVPPKLRELYTFCLERRDSQLDSIQMSIYRKNVLAVTMVALEPLPFPDVEVLADLPKNRNAVRLIVQGCEPFLTIRDDTVHFVDQSARDFLLEHPAQLFTGSEEIVNSKKTQRLHHQIFQRSLEEMDKILNQDIYSLGRPGVLSDEIVIPDPNPLRPVQYACRHWVSHLVQSQPSSNDMENVLQFLERNFLCWLEALSLLGNLPYSIGLMDQLQSLSEAQKCPGLLNFLGDGRRLIVSFLSCDFKAPLQLYVSALVFSPEESIVRRRFQEGTPQWSLKTPKMIQNTASEDSDGHSRSVKVVEIAPDGLQVATGGEDGLIKLWDLRTGNLRSSFVGLSATVTSVTFSSNCKLLVAVSKGDALAVWNIEESQPTKKFERAQYHELNDVEFSQDDQLIRAKCGEDAQFWDVESGSRVTEDSTKSVQTTNARDYLTESQMPINAFDEWVFVEGERALLLPPDYRPTQWAMHDNTLVIGTMSGDAHFICFNQRNGMFGGTQAET